MNGNSLRARHRNYHNCVAKGCNNTTVKTPGKLWIIVPSDMKRRNTWLRLARRDPESFSTEYNMYLCEDHFDLENDMENYMEYKLMGSVKRIRMKPVCAPSRFECHADRKGKSNATSDSLVASNEIALMPVMEVKKLTESTLTFHEAPVQSALQQNIQMDNQQVKDELCQKFKTEPSDIYDEQTNTTTEMITTLHEVKPDLDEIAETNPGADRNTQINNHQLNVDVYQALKSELSELNDQTNTSTEQTTEHHKDESDASTFVCNHCSRQFTAKSSLEQHVVSDHSSAASEIVIVESGSLKCTECGFEGKTMDSVKRHASLHDEKIKFVCSTCGYRFVNKHMLRTHIKIHANRNVIERSKIRPRIGDESVNCDHCEYESDDTKKQLNRQSRVKPYKCDHCDYKSSHKSHIKQHLNIHTGVKPYKCDRCDYKSAYKSHIKQHLKIHTGVKPYKCDRCNYECVCKSDLTKHLKIHTGVKPYECQHCEYKSAFKGDVTRHLKIHTGKKPYKCNQCDYKSAYKTHFKQHVKLHTGVKPYECDHCNFKTAFKGDITRHSKIHTGVKPYKCDHCNFKSAFKGDVTRHSKIHTGVKPYKCDHCDYTSAYKTHIKQHLNIHTGVKPYKCDHCDYESAQKINVQKHLKVHTGEKPYECDHCNYKSAQRSNITRHLKTHTGKTLHNSNR